MERPRQRLLDYLLKRVPFEGWTQRALENAAADAGVHPAELSQTFPDGAIEAIDYFVSQADTAMVEGLASYSLETMRMPERISTIIMVRLKQQAPHKEAVRRALAISALPQNAVPAWRTLSRTIDTIWHAAGDTSADFSYYTKRMTLMGVYSSTLLFWLNDTSEDLINTREFLERRLANVMQFHRFKKRCKEAARPLKEFSFRRLFKGPRAKKF